MSQRTFKAELMHVINCHSKENGSNTPDHILAGYLIRCLDAFDDALQAREKWYGRPIHQKPDAVLNAEPQQ